MADEKKDPLTGKQVDVLTDQLEELNTNVEKLDTSVKSSVKSAGLLPSFGRGIASALGAVIGATVVLAIIIYILQALAGVPFVGHWFDSLVNQITIDR